MPSQPLIRLRKLCRALPESHEVEAWGEPTFRVRNKLFAMYASAETHHGGGRPAVWIKAAPGNQGLMVRAAPDRFFVPPYVGPSGWVGVWLDGSVDWNELADLLRDSYSLVAPKRLRLSSSRALRTAQDRLREGPDP
jgi:predicted DNA-binding protein (MmcQ/YjbR family)